LIDGTTGLSAAGASVTESTESVKVIKKENKYHDVLAKFPMITKPVNLKKTTKHTTVHHIKTMQGPPEACRPCRLAPEATSGKNGI